MLPSQPQTGSYDSIQMVVSLISAESTHTPFCTEGVDAQLFLSQEKNIMLSRANIDIDNILFIVFILANNEIVCKLYKIQAE